MNNTIIEHVFAALRAAGPNGLTANEVAQAVSLTRGKPTSRECIWKAMADRRTANGPGPRLQHTTAERYQRWTIVDDVADPPPLPLPEIEEPDAPVRILAWPRSVTAALMGDPLPGRSVHDQRQLGLERHAQ